MPPHIVIGETQIKALALEIQQEIPGHYGIKFFIDTAKSNQLQILRKQPDNLRSNAALYPIANCPAVTVDRHKFLNSHSFDEAYSFIYPLLQPLHVATCDKEKIASALIRRTRTLIIRHKKNRHQQNRGGLVIAIALELDTTLWERSSVTASCDSIANLERGEPAEFLGEDYGDKCCAICMEGFREGSDVTCMPCTHVFDTHCIRKWLHEKSNRCPVCRFQLPTNSDVYVQPAAGVET